MKICVRKFTDRKRPCLVLEQGNHGVVLAMFRNEKMVKVFMKALKGNVIDIPGNTKTVDQILEEVHDS